MVFDSDMVTVMLDGGPLHGMRRLRQYTVEFVLKGGTYRRIGQTEAGISLFRWYKTKEGRG